jgi:hypothetical protein
MFQHLPKPPATKRCDPPKPPAKDCHSKHEDHCKKRRPKHCKPHHHQQKHKKHCR